MGGINPCDRPPHAAATGDHGEKLTDTLFGAFAAFLDAHRSVEQAILSETYDNDVGAIDHARSARSGFSDSFDLLQRARIHLRSFAERLETKEDFDRAVRELDSSELGEAYADAGIILRDLGLWNDVTSETKRGGMQAGFSHLLGLMEQVEEGTRSAIEESRKLPELASNCNVEPSIRYNEFPFIEVNQRLLSTWQELLSAYQYICLVSLEAFSNVNDSPAPIQRGGGQSRGG